MSLPLILVVEDNKSDQHMLKHLLEKFDFTPQIVANGAGAIADVRTTRYAVILLSMTLPDMNGYDCAKLIKEIDLELSSQTPIVGMGSQSERDDKNASAPLISDFLTKPFSDEDLRKVLLRHAYEPRRPNLKTLTPLSLDEATIPPSMDDR